MRFFYLRNKKKFPVACVATELCEDGKIHWALSTHNPLDKYNRQVAQDVARGRMTLATANQIPPYRHVLSGILLLICTESDIKRYPQRAKDAARLWLKKQKAKAEKKATAA